jgi:hypothetical protein
MTMSLLIALLVGATSTATDPAGCSLGLPIPEEENKATWALPTSEQAQREFKGVELYSWQGSGGEMCFALLRGTNYVKSITDVVNPETTVVGVEELGRRMLLLAVDESIGWGPPRWVDGLPKSVRMALRYPPTHVIEAVLSEAALRGRQVTLLERRYWDARVSAIPKATQR